MTSHEHIVDASYIVFKEDSKYLARNGQTGAVDYSGTVAHTVINDTLGNLTAGRTWKEKVVLKGDITLTGAINIPSYTILEIQGRLITTDTGINLIMVVGSLDPHDKEVEIVGGCVEGASGATVKPIYLDKVDDILVKGVHVKSDKGCMVIERANRVTVKDCDLEATATGGTSIHLHSYGTQQTKDCKILDNYIHGLGMGVLAEGVSGQLSEGHLIMGNEFTGWSTAPNHGIYLGHQYSENCQVLGNFFHDSGTNGGNAIEVRSSHHTIDNNMFRDVTTENCIFIAVTSGDSVALEGVTCTGNTMQNVRQAFYVMANPYAVTHVSIVGNQIDTCSQSGIRVDGTGSVKVQLCLFNSNTINGCSQYGIYLNTEAENNEVIGNTVSGCGTAISANAGENDVAHNQTA